MKHRFTGMTWKPNNSPHNGKSSHTHSKPNMFAQKSKASSHFTL